MTRILNEDKLKRVLKTWKCNPVEVILSKERPTDPFFIGWSACSGELLELLEEKSWFHDEQKSKLERIMDVIFE